MVETFGLGSTESQAMVTRIRPEKAQVDLVWAELADDSIAQFEAQAFTVKSFALSSHSGRQDHVSKT
jgi:hypothetical protein